MTAGRAADIHCGNGNGEVYASADDGTSGSSSPNTCRTSCVRAAVIRRPGADP
ncbi:hypothetical protein [Streptomyces sp. NPDC002402]